MKVLVVGGGGREHAICKALSQSPLCEKLYCTPGNAGIEEILLASKGADAAKPNKVICWDIPVEKIEKISVATKIHGIDFVIVGPEVPLALGLVDELRAMGVPTFGPDQQAAELESSKGFMKDLCAKAGVPTAKYKRFTDPDQAKAYINQQGAPIVVKADGLAAGKGVTVARTIDEAIAAVDDAMVDGVFGASGAEVVVEEFMEGEEASFFALCDGKTARFFASAQDHKAVYDGDKGPNTGGMGAYSPAPVVDEKMTKLVMDEIIFPTVEEMKKMGRPFTGVLFAGLMITKDGPRLIEYNARFGDPETEVMIPRLKTDLLELLYACSTGKLSEAEMQWHDFAALTVVMAADGYPGNYLKGTVIGGLEKAAAMPDAVVYHAGTVRNEQGEILANGGRVLCITANASTISDAQKKAYAAVDQINWVQGFCRRDIGWRAIARENIA